MSLRSIPSVPPWITRTIDFDVTVVWLRGIRLVLSLLIVTILLALTGGVVKTFLDLALLIHDPLEVALRTLIIDILLVLAVVEVFKTTLTYFSEGRVKVTFIVDTILVVMLVMLAAIRVLAVRFSPAQADGIETL
ncbi:phosphate-starvation-inducible PsiE family protein [Candidatus Nitrospira bockiana]